MPVEASELFAHISHFWKQIYQVSNSPFECFSFSVILITSASYVMMLETVVSKTYNGGKKVEFVE